MAKGQQKPQSQPETTGEEQERIAYLIRDGDDEAVRKAMGETIPGFEKWPKRDKEEAVRLTREFWKRPIPEELTIGANKGIAPAGDPSLAILRITKAFASSSEHLCNDRLAQLANYLAQTPNGSSDENVSSAFAFVAGGGAQDTVQSALLTQMAATHDASMRAIRRMEAADFVDTAHLYGNLSTRLMNLYARQAETLAKLQRGGEQTVRHLYVDARTQTAYNYPPSQTEVREQSHEQHEGGTLGPSMLGYNTQGNGMPISGDAREKAVQATRREGDGSTERK